MSYDPQIVASPRFQGGEPILDGFCIAAEAIVQQVWCGYTLADLARNTGLTQADVVVACWFCVVHGRPYWRKRWREWINANGEALMNHHIDLADIPLPPSSKGGERDG